MNRLAIGIALLAALGCACPRPHAGAEPPAFVSATRSAPDADSATVVKITAACDRMLTDALERLVAMEEAHATDAALEGAVGETPAGLSVEPSLLEAHPALAAALDAPDPDPSHPAPSVGELQRRLGRALVRLRACMDTHARNFANGDTVAYKAVAAHGRANGGGAEDLWTTRDFAQGALSETGRELDWAIDGAGFFQIQLPNNSVAYTRGGNFEIDREGNVVTPHGYVLQPNIQIPENVIAITVDQTGIVFGFDPTNPGVQQELGQLQLFRFMNPPGLSAIGENLYQETPASGNPIQGQPGSEQFGSIRQGFLERSNGDVVAECVNLMEDTRSFELAVALIRRLDRAERPPDGGR